MAAPPALTLAMADSCLAALHAPFGCKTSSHRLIPFRTKPVSFLRLSCSSFSLSFAPFGLSLAKKKVPSVVSLVARTSDWARQDEEEEQAVESGEGDEDFEWEGENKGFGLLDGEGAEDDLSEWEGKNQGGAEVVGEVAEGDSPVNEGFLEGVGDDSFSEPPEEAKLFVGNLPYDVDSEKLAHLFEKAGIVEVAEVIYNRESGQSRGFGFVNMSTVEEAEKAVEMFHRYDCNGRLLSVNIATPRGSVPERSPREFESSSVRIYVGNLPWQVDDARLEQVFSKHGKVVNARVVYDRETGRSRGFGFVTMASKTDHEDAIEALDGQTLDGRAIRVNVAEERPRRGSF